MTRRAWSGVAGLLALTLALGCGDDSSGAGATGAGGESGGGGVGFSANPPLILDVDDRPAGVQIPEDYDPEITYPLLVSLHGRGVNGRVNAGFFQLTTVIEEQQYVLVYPDGLNAVWNATDACCDPTRSVDDVGYISRLIEAALQTYNTDPRRVYLMGISNGGFMALRMACERSDLITAVLTIAGAAFENPDDCAPSELPVSALIVHGTEDMTIMFEGGNTGLGPYPSANETVERVATRAGCDLENRTPLENIDLFSEWEGPETEREVFNGCDEGLAVEFWTIQQGDGCVTFSCNPHIPLFGQDWAIRTTNWLLERSR